jgi:hypothetical protein
MSQRQRFIRKIVYACVIAALLLPLSWLSQPAAKDGSKGGLLAQMRAEHNLSQADLGEIDPASETIKLATLGMRGVAANILWEKANQYHKEEDWAGLSATLEQIVRLQPNFVSVWVFQGWNLSYNISVEFDDYHDRYRWVIKGIDFLKEGTQYNRDEPRLLTDIGWTVAHKIGKADERVQYRRLFREDDEFNGSRPLAQRDNWLVGREWLVKAEQIVARGIPLKGKSPLLFYSRPPMCLVNYAQTLEEEGTFGEVAKNAWKKASDSWTEFSDRDLPTQHNLSVRLGEKEAYLKRAQEAQAELARLTPPGLREEIAKEKFDALSEQERTAHDTPSEQRTPEQHALLAGVKHKLEIHHLDIADRITGETHSGAFKAAEDATQADFMAKLIDSEREIVNFDYWTLKCRIEPDDSTLAARKAMYDGDRAFSKGDLVACSQAYEEGLKTWRQVLDKYPSLLKDSDLTEDLVASIGHYRSILHQMDKEFPKTFILQDVLDADAALQNPKVPLSEGASSGAASSTANDPSNAEVPNKDNDPSKPAP